MHDYGSGWLLLHASLTAFVKVGSLGWLFGIDFVTIGVLLFLHIYAYLMWIVLIIPCKGHGLKSGCNQNLTGL